MFIANSPTAATIPTLSKTVEDTIPGQRRQESLQTSTETSDQDSALYISPKKARRRQRQSLSAISNKSMLANDGAEISAIVSSRLNREKLAWETINAEILEWQTVCRTGRPSWWSPASRWTCRRRVRSTTSRDLGVMGISECVGSGDNWTTPAQRFEQQNHILKDTPGTQEQATQQQAFITAVQLLSVSFTLPVEQFQNYKNSANLYFTTLASDGIPDARLISSLRMHTDYRWSPAFGHEARSTSPEYHHKAAHGRELPLGGLGDAPLSLDLSYSGGSRRSKRRRKRHRVRYVTPADSSRQDHVEKSDDQRSNPDPPRSAFSSLEESVSDSTRQTKSHLIPGRRAHSCPVSPTLTTKSVTSRGHRLHHHLPTQVEIDEPPPETPQARWQLESSRYTLEPAIRSEPHPVFIQPVKELVVKSWQTFRKKLDNTLSRGCPDPGGTSAQFNDEQLSLSWPPPAGPPSTSWAVQRRRNARERHDIYSSSVESSPRYNSLTSGTRSDASSPIRTDPTASPAGRAPPSLAEVVNAPKANTTPTSSVPSLLSNNTSDADSESSGPKPIPRNAAGFFIKASGSGPNHTIPVFVPLRGSNRRARRRSMLSEVSTPYEDITLAEAEQRMMEGIGANVTAKFPAETMCEAGSGPHKLAKCRSLDELNWRGLYSADDSNDRAEENGVETGKSRLQRVSSAGTTVITPSDDSAEVHIWDERDRKGKRRTRSFL
ncbi:hypothetical protein V490_01956 [Pseudogymnoascus sp. VKM F-3557]|nr:hypothetical protein V490_01956 [Pseudogymnoascus sp. VKM F-3557]